MASFSPVTDSLKRPRGHGLSADRLCLDFCEGVYSSCNKRRGPLITQQKVSPSSSSSACVHMAFSTGKEVIGSSYSRSHESSAPVSSSASALTDTADSSTLGFPLPHECTCGGGHELLCCASSDEGAESCCGENDTSKLDIACFLLHEVWDDAGSEGCDAFALNPESIFPNGGPSTYCSEDVAFVGCSTENGNWFLNDLEGESSGYLNEVLDQEWMAAAVANLDRINDTLDADLCVLHLFESDHGDVV